MNDKNNIKNILPKQYTIFLPIFYKIDSLMESHPTVIIAIDGNSGAGKTTLAKLISNIYDCNVFHMDHFFLRPELRTDERLNEIGGNVDYVRFNEEIIKGLKSGREFKYKIYNCKKMKLDEYIYVIPKKLNIIEGVYSMHPTLIHNYNLKIFLHIDKKTQINRLLKRENPIMIKRFIEQWIPMENEYFKKMKIQEKSDLIFNV